MREPVWLFDLDDTLHHASAGIFAALGAAMNDYIVRHLGVTGEEAQDLRRRYWRRYGATLLGLVRHHAIVGSHFLDETHALPQLEEGLRASAPDIAWLRRLRGRKVLLTNAPARYARRVLRALNLLQVFDAVITVEEMQIFGHWRPKPDVRMFRHVCARLRVSPSQCILVEDSLANLKAARRLGMSTVWMRGWSSFHHPHRPAFVDRRVSRLRELKSFL
ncbi:pyrimidine 5'-nucleotidase [Roseateles terrae]|uniref:Hydrolase of the HAD superfamily n=1 Tax=Roseateles terrae TaxID=431060 RepID=A0ABR6GYA8_9BURK|nr:pyrimidine 5'-nucleotidase [Roseateles terrae]MBB3197088.1 putative hydrolase of the HAD superfamily [Roseateles terrae]OWQ84248.1 pyrimidine 5'-nucleotidase [Roseateles terrae]